MPSSCCSPWPARPSCEKEPGITPGPDGSIIGEAGSVAAAKKAKVFWSKTFLPYSWKENKEEERGGATGRDFQNGEAVVVEDWTETAL